MPQSKKGRYVRCTDCGCGLEMNGVCKICGHTDNPLLPGMVPNIIGQTEAAAAIMLLDPEAQLTLGTITEENSSTVEAGLIISSDPEAGAEINIGNSVNIIVSLGPV